MVRMIWDISVAAFLNVQGPVRKVKPIQFKIYCIAGIEPLMDALGGAGKIVVLTMAGCSAWTSHAIEQKRNALPIAAGFVFAI